MINKNLNFINKNYYLNMCINSMIRIIYNKLSFFEF